MARKQTNYFYKFHQKGRSVDIGRAVKLCRSQKGWTLRELSKQSGIAVSHLSMIERNQKKDLSPYLWGMVFAAAALFLGVMVYATAPGVNLAGNTQSRTSQVR